jgi:UDP-N-acetyl-D-glucosamine dehydrogenase
MNDMEQIIRAEKTKVGIIGLGYVGLPLAVEFGKKGFAVTGFEVDGAKVKDLAGGRSYIPDIPTGVVQELVEGGKLSATMDFKKLAKMDAIIICVPTPLRKSKDPDISYIVSAVEKIQPNLRKGQLVILESTTYPGTTREVVMPRLEERGLKAGKDFHLAFSPERVDPGNKRYGIRNTPKIVGGLTPACTRLAGALYGAIVDRVVEVTSMECAEMVKLLENTFRAVNIGLVNEVALMCERLGLDTWEVIESAATKPFGFMPFYPGPGLGGHCIPLDPHYLSWKLKTLNFYARFIELAGEINSHMPEVVVARVGEALNEKGKALKGSKVLVLGVAYKKDIGDVRESPALDVIELLKGKGASVSYHDPYAASLRIGAHAMKSVKLSEAVLRGQDCVVITTDHGVFDVPAIVKASRLVFDTRNATKGLKDAKIRKL